MSSHITNATPALRTAWLPARMLVICLALAAPGTAGAIGIGLVAGDHAAFPASDPDGLQLALAVEAAANHYGSIVRDPWRFDVEFRYAPSGSLGRAALALPEQFLEYDPIGSPGKKRLFRGTILFNPDARWYFDPTPRDHSEFQLQQTLWRDASAAELGSWFDGTGPPELEIAYRGRAQESVGLDALTIALHELGHLMGVSNVRPELDDADFDLAPDLVHSATLAARTSSSRDHLLAVGTVMGTTLSPGERRLPSTTDLLAMVATAGWRDIDLPRKEFWGGGQWHESGNWAGNRLPDLADDVFIRAGRGVSLGGEAQAGRLFLDEGASLLLGGHRLQVGELHLGRDTRLFHEADGNISGDRLFMDGSATLSTTVGAGGAVALGIFFEGAQLAGTLELRSDGEVAPAGSVYPLLLAASLEGHFDRVLLAGESAWEGSDVLFSTETIGGLFEQLSAQVVVAGDTNADGIVDQADLDAVLVGWGRTVPAAWLESGDLDGNGLVDQGDLDRVLTNWGRSAGDLTSASHNIPEPAAATLALLCAAAILIVKQSTLTRSASEELATA